MNRIRTPSAHPRREIGTPSPLATGLERGKKKEWIFPWPEKGLVGDPGFPIGIMCDD